MPFYIKSSYQKKIEIEKAKKKNDQGKFIKKLYEERRKREKEKNEDDQNKKYESERKNRWDDHTQSPIHISTYIPTCFGWD